MRCVDDVEVPRHLPPTDSEDENLHRQVHVNGKGFRHRSHCAIEWGEVSAFAAHLEVHVIVGGPGIEPARAGLVGESNAVLALADVLVDVGGVVRHRLAEDVGREFDGDVERGGAVAVGSGAQCVDGEQSPERRARARERGGVIGANRGRRFPLAACE